MATPVQSMPDAAQAEVPLCIDLDGTLIRSDLLVESALALLRRNPLHAFSIAGWLLKGKAHLKQEIAARTEIDASVLPYESRLVECCRPKAVKDFASSALLRIRNSPTLSLRMSAASTECSQANECARGAPRCARASHRAERSSRRRVLAAHCHRSLTEKGN